MTPSYQIAEIEISQIFADPNFNCRGSFNASDCMALANDMQADGQLHPVMVRPYNNPDQPQYKWQLVEGFRRLVAAKINRWETIKASIASDLTDERAAIINFAENLHRQNLTFEQEARALDRFKIGKVDDGVIAKKLNVSRSWVTMRKNFLNFPAPIQREIALGIIPQIHISELARMKSDEERYEAIKNYKDKKSRGKSAKIQASDTKAKAPHIKKARTRPECLEMQTHIREAFRGYGELDEITPYLRCLAWAAGIITDTDLYLDLQQKAADLGIEYTVPSEVFEILKA